MVGNRYRQEILERGRSIAASLSREAAGPMLGRERLGLELKIRETLRLEKDLAVLIQVLGADERGASIPLSQM